MILGILGKGGSGKSTVSTLLATYAAESGWNTLAIDADHNMDFAYNLGAELDDAFPYFGSGLSDVMEAAGYARDENYRTVFAADKEPRFSLSPGDTFTETYGVQLKNGITMMVAGPHTADILHDQSCSHILTTPLKVYLPHLVLNERELVVVDEKAGVDGVGTGVASGFSLGIVIAEPTPHGIKAAQQIIETLTFFGVPYGVIANKVRDASGAALVESAFPGNVIAELPFTSDDPTSPQEIHAAVAQKIISFATATCSTSEDRVARAKERAARNAAFQSNA